MIYLAEHFCGILLFALGLGSTGYVLDGDWLGHWPRGLRNLGRWILGLVFWISSIFILAAFGWLHPTPLSVLALGIFLLALRRFVTQRAAAIDTHPAVGEAPGSLSGSERLFLLAMVVLVLMPLMLLAMTPTVSWDASAYHLTVPRLYIEAGGFRPIEFNVYSNWPLGTEMLFTGALMAQDFVLAKLVHFGFGLLVLYGLWIGAERWCGRWGRTVGALAMACFLANDVVFFEMRVAYVDLAHAFYLLAGFLFLECWRETKDSRALILAGLAAGLMAGVKLNGFVGAGLLLLLLLPHGKGPQSREDRWAIVRCFVAPMVLLWLPWLVKSVAYTGNPVYPLLYNVFGGPDWNTTLSESLRSWQSSIGMGRGVIDYLLLPYRVVFEGGRGYDQFDGTLGTFWALALPFVLWGARRSGFAGRALILAGLYGVSWAMTSQQMRLLIPALPPVALAMATGVSQVFGPMAEKRQRMAQVVVLGLALALVIWVNGSVLVSGVKSLGRYVSSPRDLLALSRPPLFQAIDQQLPLDSKILFLNTNQGFFCTREFLADSFFEASQVAAWLAPAESREELEERLAGRGITHILLDRRPLAIPYPPVLGEVLADPSFATPIIQSPDGRFMVLELQR